MTTVMTFRFTLGEKRTENFTKWHHFFVRAGTVDEARDEAEKMFEAAVATETLPRHFLALRYEKGVVVEAWKFSYSSREYEPYPIGDYLADQVAFKKRMAEKRQSEQKMSEHADANWQRLFDQFADLAESVRTYLGDRSSANLKAVEEAVSKVTFV